MPYKFNGKELDEETGLYYYGARYMQPVASVFFNTDRYTEKYPHLSAYNHCAGNPVNLMDVNGDSLWISHKGNDYLYQDGSLYNRDGSAYKGKVKGFLSQSVNALNSLRTSEEGIAMISELQSSVNNFKIVKGNSKFNSTNLLKAHANQLMTDPAQAMTLQALQKKGIDISGGSGGNIFWDPSGVTLPTTSGEGINEVTDLAHEMFHGLDANRGLLDDRLEQEVKRDEWQATYRENLLRSQLGKPLRTHYRVSVDIDGVFQGGSGPYMLTPSMAPFLPNWYNH